MPFEYQETGEELPRRQKILLNTIQTFPIEAVARRSAMLQGRINETEEMLSQLTMELQELHADHRVVVNEWVRRQQHDQP